MPMSGSASALGSALLNRAWAQWISFGVDAVGERDDAVVDPEALIALTAELGEADARLRDVSTDWCVEYGRYVNGSRLKQVTHELRTPPEAIGEYVATVAAAGGPTWPMATQPRAEYRTRGKARLDSAVAPPLLRIRLARGVRGECSGRHPCSPAGRTRGRRQRRRPNPNDAFHQAERRRQRSTLWCSRGCSRRGRWATSDG